MVEYTIDIHWVQAYMDGIWEWSLYLHGELVRDSTSYWRWSGLWAAKRHAKRHARGKVPPPDDGSRTIKYTVWDR